MPRKKYEWYKGSRIHVIARGNHRNDIFRDEIDYEVYLNYLKEAIEYYENKYCLIAYVLMTNHVHIVIETTDKDVSDFIKRVHSRYAWNFNKKYNYIGHLFQDRYRGELIKDDKYMLEVSRYVHLNPVRAKMVEKPERYKWSSYNIYIREKEEKLVNADIVLNYFKNENKHKLYKEFVESKIKENSLKVEEIDNYAFIGELSLNGDLRPCDGVLPMVMKAKNKGIRNIVVPNDNVKEASLVKDMNIFAFNKLHEVTDFLIGVNPYESIINLKDKHHLENPYIIDFQDVQGQDSAIEFVAVAAAGGHNLLMSGSPGCGKSMVAKRIPTILPSMTEEEALEVTKIYSVAGLLKNRGSLISERPFRSPHHNASTNSLIGGGIFAMPGEISLAHNGILFLDEIAEFNKKTLDALRQPMEDGKVTIARVKNTHLFPANFMLVAAMNPCPCGYYGESRCHCTDYEVLKYREKLSGPIMDRIDIQKYFKSVNIMDLSDGVNGPSSKSLMERIEVARKIQRERYKNIVGVSCNAQMSPELIREYCELDEASKNLLKIAYEKFKYSARTYHKFLRVARTFADMDMEDKINKSYIIKALMCREIEKEQATMVVV